MESHRRKDHLLGEGLQSQARLELRAIALHNCCACHEHLGNFEMALKDISRAKEYASGPLYAQLMAVEASVRVRMAKGKGSSRPRRRRSHDRMCVFVC